MAFFRRKSGRWWKTSANGGRYSNHNGRPKAGAEERRYGTLLLGVAFYAAVGIILNIGEPPLDIRQGEVAKRDYRARVDFTCRDLDATEQLRLRESDRMPNVYRYSPEVLDTARNSCIGVVRGLLGKTGEPGAARPGEASALGPEQWDALRSALTPMGEEAVNALKRIFSDPPLTMVIRDQEYSNEIQQYGQGYISIILKEGQPAKRVNIYETVPLDEKLPIVLGDLVSKEFKQLGAEDQANLTELIVERFKDLTLQYSEKDTKQARDEARKQVKWLTKKIGKGETLLPAGAVATEARILELDEERREFFRAQPASARLKRMVGIALLLGLLCFGFALYVYGFHGQILKGSPRLGLMALLCIGLLILAKVLVYAGWPVLLVPVPFVAVTFTLLYNQRIALGAATMVALMLGIISAFSFSVYLVFVVGGLVGAMATTGVRTRTKLVNVGFLAGLAQFGAVWAVNLASDANIGAEFWRSVTFMDSMVALANGVLCGFLITGLLPFVERLFGVVTEISLLEWSDVNRPVLRRLVLEAPGTYHHSVLVGNLSEAAAQAIGANALLARTAAYYHDIGKLVKPEYFVENSTEAPARHEKLSPALSALILTAHTRDGAQMAEQYRIPTPIRDIIEQHHGTTLVEYFYQKAVQQAGGNGRVDPECFRYRGPKAQTPEACIVLLADAVESASRAMSEPTPSRIDSLVREIAQKRLADAQLDDCPITIKEMRKIEQSLIRELTAMFHTRIRYPRV